MIVTLLVARILADTPLISGERAISAAKAVLAKFDVPGPYRLAGLSHSDRRYTGDNWNVALASAKGVRFQASVDAHTGEIRSAERDHPFLNEKAPMGNPAIARKWLDRIHPSWPARYSSRDRMDPRQVLFKTLVHGYAFVYPEQVGHRFIVRNGAFAAYFAPPKLPNFGPATARLTSRDALNALKRFQLELENHDEPRGWRVASFRPGVSELGWAQPEGERLAVLAWRVGYRVTLAPGSSTIVSATPATVSEGTILIDANTGQRIKTRYGT